MRLPDDHLEKYLKMFTLLPLPEISSAISRHVARPERRVAHHLLAKEVVTLIHGPTEAATAEFTTHLLFPTGRQAKFSAAEIISAFGDKVAEVLREELVGEMLTKVVRRIGAVKTRAEALSAIQGGGMYVGLENEKVRDAKARVEEGWLVDGEALVVRIGKGRFYIVRAI